MPRGARSRQRSREAGGRGACDDSRGVPRGDVTTIDLRLDRGEWPYDPIAPATLWTDDDQSVLELHKLLRLDEDAASFASYDLDGDRSLAPGQYRMFSGWDKGQYQVATDRDVEWRRGTFDKPGDHTHCILTWETIEHGDPGTKPSRGAAGLRSRPTRNTFATTHCGSAADPRHRPRAPRPPGSWSPARPQQAGRVSRLAGAASHDFHAKVDKSDR